MEKTQELFNQIERHLKKDLNGEDLRDFEALLKENPELKEEIDNHQLILDTVLDKDTIAFRKMLQSIDQELENEKKGMRYLFKPWQIAASIVILLGFSLTMLLNSSSKPDLYSTYYTPYPTTITRGNESNTVSLDGKIITAYANGNYETAIPLLEKLVRQYSTNDRLKIYLGNSYLNLNLEGKAIAIFGEITNKSDQYANARWFMALGHLKKKQLKESRAILIELKSFENLYTKIATELLNKMD